MSMRDLGQVDVSNISKPLKQGLQVLHDGAVGQIVHPQAGHPLHIAWWPSEHPGALEISLQNEECLNGYYIWVTYFSHIWHDITFIFFKVLFKDFSDLYEKFMVVLP